jgi:hypothetical protein
MRSEIAKRKRRNKLPLIERKSINQSIKSHIQELAGSSLQSSRKIDENGENDQVQEQDRDAN